MREKVIAPLGTIHARILTETRPAPTGGTLFLQGAGLLRPGLESAQTAELFVRSPEQRASCDQIAFFMEPGQMSQ